MRYLFWGLVISTFASANCIAADPIYLTATDRIDRELGASHAFIGPYYTGADTTLFVQISKTDTSTSSKGSDTGNPSATEIKPTLASIDYAIWMTDPQDGTKGLIRYAVNCDLSTTLEEANAFIVSDVNALAGGKSVPADDANNPFNGQKTIDHVTISSVYVQAQAPPAANIPQYNGGGTTKVTCPQPQKASSFAVSFGVNTIPQSRRYLYLAKDAFFADSINYSVDSNGMLSNLDTSSTQQITNILTELAQTVGGFLPLAHIAAAAPKQDAPKQKALTARQKCFNTIGTLLKDGPYNSNAPIQSHLSEPWVINLNTGATITNEKTSDVTLEFKIQRSPDAIIGAAERARRAVIRATRHAVAEIPGFSSHNLRQQPVHAFEQTAHRFPGLVAFFPEPARVTLACSAEMENNSRETVFLSAPSVVYLYTNRQYLNPQRDFLTNPQDTFTFNGGFITGHKYTSQSSAKTIVDTITSPVRALFPSVSVQQQVQVQTGGGKPDQTTTTTQTTLSPSKSQ